MPQYVNNGTDQISDFIDRMRDNPVYYEYDAWDIIENELYDFTY